MLFILLLEILLALGKADATTFANGQIQPGVYPAPVLPKNFTKSSKFWRSPAAALPKFDPRQLRNLSRSRIGKEAANGIGPRQPGNGWRGWQNVRYLFTL